MRKTLVTLAAAAAFASAASLIPIGAQATPLSLAAGSTGVIAEIDAATPVNFDCRRVWRCGPFGCGFRSFCGGPGFAGPH